MSALLWRRGCLKSELTACGPIEVLNRRASHLPLLYTPQERPAPRRRMQRPMPAQAGTTQSEQLQLLISSSDDDSLSALRSRLAEVRCIVTQRGSGPPRQDMTQRQ